MSPDGGPYSALTRTPDVPTGEMTHRRACVATHPRVSGDGDDVAAARVAGRAAEYTPGGGGGATTTATGGAVVHRHAVTCRCMGAGTVAIVGRAWRRAASADGVRGPLRANC